MKIKSIEVKTTYRVALDIDDLARILDDYNRGEGYAAPGTFRDFETCDLTRAQLLDMLRRLPWEGNKQTFDYIAQRLGMDGWSNAGTYDDTGKTYTLTLYKNGDALN